MNGHSQIKDGTFIVTWIRHRIRTERMMSSSRHVEATVDVEDRQVCRGIVGTATLGARSGRQH